jgi:hypothetical protein
VFVSCCSVGVPSSVRSGNRVEEDLLSHSSDSERAQTRVSWTPTLGVTGPPGIASVSELSR